LKGADVIGAVTEEQVQAMLFPNGVRLDVDKELKAMNAEGK
jgi:hypothetical protein